MCKKILGSLFLTVFLFIFSANAQTTLSKKTQTLLLGETSVKVNIYERKGSAITFIAVHHNEQTSIRVAKELIAKRGGRLIEIESVNEEGRPLRRLRFTVQEKTYSVDPNRIFTDNGRACDQSSAEAAPQIEEFADKLLRLILPNRNGLRRGEKFVVALHNNGDINREGLSQEQREGDLTAFSFIKGGTVQHPLRGTDHLQVAGVFLSNAEDDEDNFLFLSKPTYLNYFGGKGFSIVLQKPAKELNDKSCEVDDGSLSVYFGQRNVEYINVEADNDTGGARQKEMIEAIYELLLKRKN